jgi:hypothetical protein
MITVSSSHKTTTPASIPPLFPDGLHPLSMICVLYY